MRNHRFAKTGSGQTFKHTPNKTSFPHLSRPMLRALSQSARPCGQQLRSMRAASPAAASEGEGTQADQSQYRPHLQMEGKQTGFLFCVFEWKMIIDLCRDRLGTNTRESGNNRKRRRRRRRSCFSSHHVDPSRPPLQFEQYLSILLSPSYRSCSTPPVACLLVGTGALVARSIRVERDRALLLGK